MTPMARRAVLVTATVLLPLAAGCGKKGPLLYPDQLVAQPPQQVAVEQQESSLRLTALVTGKDLTGRTLKDLERVLISRRLCHDPDCSGCLEPFQERTRVPVDGTAVSWIDGDTRVGERYQYRLQTEQKGAVLGKPVYSRPVPIAGVPEAPQVTVRPVFGGRLLLLLQGKTAGPARQIGYRVYRADGPDTPLRLLAQLPSEIRQYEDTAVVHGVVYRYTARQVVRMPDGLVVEGLPSLPVEATVSDDAP